MLKKYVGCYFYYFIYIFLRLPELRRLCISKFKIVPGNLHLKQAPLPVFTQAMLATSFCWKVLQCEFFESLGCTFYHLHPTHCLAQYMLVNTSVFQLLGKAEILAGHEVILIRDGCKASSLYLGKLSVQKLVGIIYTEKKKKKENLTTEFSTLSVSNLYTELYQNSRTDVLIYSKIVFICL